MPPVPPVVPLIRLNGAGGNEVALDFALARETPVPARKGTSSNLVDFFFLAELSTLRVAGFEKDRGEAIFG